MTRATLVLAIASLTILAGSARSDPSFTVPAPSATAPGKSLPGSSAPFISAPSTVSQAAPAPPLAAAPGVPAAPQPPAPSAAEEGRYSFHRSGDSFIRLDTQTGLVAQCGWGATGWSCKTAPDERAALESEISRLQRENAELKRSLLSHGLELPAGAMAEAPSQPPPVPPAKVPDPTPSKEPKGPSDVDANRAIAFMKHVWQRLVDLMVDLQRDIQRKS